MSSDNSKNGGSIARLVRTALVVAGGGAVGIVAPIGLAVHLAVPPGEGVSGLPDSVRVQDVSLGSSARDALPVPTKRISALSIAPQSVRTLTRVFDRYDYDLARATGEGASVPPIFVERMPEDWQQIDQAKTRKRLFVKMVLPMILRANAEIRQDRRRLLALIERADGDRETLTDGGRYWLSKLARRYGLTEIQFDALKRRVDIIPPSLALAQAANESGWGTSRFAREGNALFGQWTWDATQGIKPKEMQKGKGNYAVRRFDNLADSVSAYMLNLNTHSAYKPMRDRRRALRNSDKPISGHALAGGLVRYSQRGQAYIEEIRGMISYNDFQRYDRVNLGSAALG